MKKKKVEDLIYPDVVGLNSQEELDKILKYNKSIYTEFMPNYDYMLFSRTTGGGGRGAIESYKDKSYAGEYYIIYNFSDIIFPDDTPIFYIF